MWTREILVLAESYANARYVVEHLMESCWVTKKKFAYYY